MVPVGSQYPVSIYWVPSAAIYSSRVYSPVPSDGVAAGLSADGSVLVSGSVSSIGVSLINPLFSFVGGFCISVTSVNSSDRSLKLNMFSSPCFQICINTRIEAASSGISMMIPHSVITGSSAVICSSYRSSPYSSLILFPSDPYITRDISIASWVGSSAATAMLPVSFTAFPYMKSSTGISWQTMEVRQSS